MVVVEKSAAAIMTVLSSCRARKLNADDYLDAMLTRLTRRISDEELRE